MRAYNTGLEYSFSILEQKIYLSALCESNVGEWPCLF